MKAGSGTRPFLLFELIDRLPSEQGTRYSRGARGAAAARLSVGPAGAPV